MEHNVTHSFNKLETFLNNQLVPGTLRRNIVPGRTFRRGEPGLDVRSRSLLAMEAKSLRSAVRLGGELSDEAFRLRPRYFRGAMGLGFGLGFCFGLNTMSLSSSELMSKTKRFVSKKNTHGRTARVKAIYLQIGVELGAGLKPMVLLFVDLVNT